MSLPDTALAADSARLTQPLTPLQQRQLAVLIDQHWDDKPRLAREIVRFAFEQELLYRARRHGLFLYPTSPWGDVIVVRPAR